MRKLLAVILAVHFAIYVPAYVRPMFPSLDHDGYCVCDGLDTECTLLDW